MDFESLKGCINTALEKLKEQDAHLFRADLSERSITSKLASYLSALPELSDWNIDCEYNRMGEIPKQLKWKGDNPSKVYPDIIIHKRGSTGPNLLVIEEKKNNEDSEEDRQKIAAYIEELNYQYGLCLAFYKNDQLEFTLEWYNAE